MSFLAFIWITTFVLLIFLVRSKMRADIWSQKNRHFTKQSAIQSNTSEAGHSHTYYVTKDPQAYAKIFVPNHLKK